MSILLQNLVRICISIGFLRKMLKNKKTRFFPYFLQNSDFSRFSISGPISGPILTNICARICIVDTYLKKILKVLIFFFGLSGQLNFWGNSFKSYEKNKNSQKIGENRGNRGKMRGNTVNMYFAHIFLIGYRRSH